jgi:predicted ATPase
VKLKRLELDRFTTFAKASFDFAPGVNVLIGENGTGKSHVLKLIYSVQESIRRHVTGEGLGVSVPTAGLEELLREMLVSVFQPDDLGRLVRRGVGRRKAKVRLVWSEQQRESHIEFTLSSLGRLDVTSIDLPSLERAIFIPTREVLSIFPGFISSYLKRESSFDRTFYDLCVALDAKPLRGNRGETRSKLLEPIEDALGGRVHNEGGRFYLKLEDGDMEAPMVAEGIRKLGMLAYLIVNGSLPENGFLLWDEPEASMNPRLTMLSGHIILGLARLGVQTWVASHDYLLTSELSLTAEKAGSRDTAFFALARGPKTDGVFLERGARLTDLEHNSILEALSELHQREEEVFVGGAS